MSSNAPHLCKYVYPTILHNVVSVRICIRRTTSKDPIASLFRKNNSLFFSLVVAFRTTSNKVSLDLTNSSVSMKVVDQKKKTQWLTDCRIKRHFSGGILRNRNLIGCYCIEKTPISLFCRSPRSVCTFSVGYDGETIDKQNTLVICVTFTRTPDWLCECVLITLEENI